MINKLTLNNFIQYFHHDRGGLLWMRDWLGGSFELYFGCASLKAWFAGRL